MGVLKNHLKLLLTCSAFAILQEANAQYFMISQIYPSNTTGEAVYSISIRNSANDSIMVLHTQEASLPPFINRYKWENGGEKEIKATLYFGKSNNPFLPERYRATKTLPPNGEMELYFTMPANFNSYRKQLIIYYSMLEDKFYSDFHKLETTGTNSSLKKCKALKEKHGVVHNRKVIF